MAHKKNEQQEYVSLPYFGINKLLPFLKPYRFILFSMIFLGLTGGLVDIILPLFQRLCLCSRCGWSRRKTRGTSMP